MKKRYLAIVLTLFPVLFFITAFLYYTLTPPRLNDLPPLKNGDLVFQTMYSPQALAIMMATHSVYTHVGFIKLDQNNDPIVVEAVGPVREISLAQWIDQGIAKRISIARVENLDEDSAQEILQAAQAYYGHPYDKHFLFDKERIYCSELVYYAFKEGPGINLGKIQRVKDLYINTTAVQNLIKQRWQTYAPCKDQNARDFESCYKIIMEQELVTPASIAHDPRVDFIYTNY